MNAIKVQTNFISKNASTKTCRTPWQDLIIGKLPTLLQVSKSQAHDVVEDNAVDCFGQSISIVSSLTSVKCPPTSSTLGPFLIYISHVQWIMSIDIISNLHSVSFPNICKVIVPLRGLWRTFTGLLILSVRVTRVWLHKADLVGTVARCTGGFCEVVSWCTFINSLDTLQYLFLTSQSVCII